jgi:precorrin-8X/cobalt-precorrin-8 methylmutase
MIDYICQPESIYTQSFSMIRAEADLSSQPANAASVAIRVIHACGMVDITSDLVVTDTFVPTATAALLRGCPILVDAEMVRHGIIPRFLKNNDIVCTLNDPRARVIGLARNTTRSAAAVDLWSDKLEGSIVVIGNAPTALFRLLELLDQDYAKPAAIIGFPVGFVGAAESKNELIKSSHDVPYATIKGRRGGSAMASAVINALLDVPA